MSDDEFDDQPLLNVEPRLRLHTPASEAEWRALDGVTVLIVRFSSDEDNRPYRHEFKYFADGRNGGPSWRNGHPVFYDTDTSIKRQDPLQEHISTCFDDDGYNPMTGDWSRRGSTYWKFVTAAIGHIQGGPDRHYCCFLSSKEGDGTDPHLPQTTAVDRDGPRPYGSAWYCPTWGSYGLIFDAGPFVSIAPGFEKELTERVYTCE
jgi:hypothetical protein